MKKLLLVALFILIAIPCFAGEQVYVMDSDSSRVVTPIGAGHTLTASNAIVASSGLILPFGTTTKIAKLLITVPSGTAYIGGSSVTIATGIAWAATQGVLSLDITDLSQVYWTGVANQKLNFIVLR